jgi:hypothetical protein
VQNLTRHALRRLSEMRRDTPPNKALQQTGLSVASLPLAPAAERRYVGRTGDSPDDENAMTWYPDLGPCDYFRTSEPQRLLAVGWLSQPQTFSKGPVAPEVFAKIARLAENALRIFVFRGFHTCELCGPLVDQRLVDTDGNRVQSSSHLNIFVPYDDKILVAPQCLPHYVAGHGYRPPPEFCDAVLRCPDPQSAFLAASIREIGGPEFVVEFERLASIKRP